jgi:hypothetical protein
MAESRDQDKCEKNKRRDEGGPLQSNPKPARNMRRHDHSEKGDSHPQELFSKKE